MKSIVAVYENHDDAVHAVTTLQKASIPTKHVSIIGLTGEEEVNKNEDTTTKSPIKVSGLAVGSVLGTTLGVLTGVGLFAIPGLGLLYGAGAIVGAVAGLDAGIIGGGLVSVFASIGASETDSKRYHDELAAGKYLVSVQGSKDEVTKAHDILDKLDNHTSLTAHR